MRLPSTKTLENAFPGKGKAVRALLESPKLARQHPAGAARIAECYNPPTQLDVTLHAINSEVEGYGVEYIRHRDDTMRDNYGLEYINLGGTYISTLIYDHSRDTWRVSSWGDIVEARMRDYE
jgi:hypothetical protein